MKEESNFVKNILDNVDYNKLSDKEKNIYNKIEKLIINWEIDGNKTAGYLTRKIISVIKKSK